MKTLFYFLFCMTLFVSCQKNTDSSEENKPVNSEAYTQTNVSYGSDALQRMDVYLPAGRSTTNTKALVLIHGGSWNSGSKSEFTPYVDTFKKRLPDYAVFNIDYRVVTNSATLFPVPENDVNNAVKYIADHSEEYAFNKDKVALLGFSAGSHLALLQGYKQTTPIKAKAVIDFFGPTDLIKMYNQPWHPIIPSLLESLMGATPTSNKTLYEQSSPVYFVTNQTPPTLILQGDSDPVVDISQSQLLNDKLQQAGVTHDMIVYPGAGHGWWGDTLSQSFDRVEAFLKANVK